MALLPKIKLKSIPIFPANIIGGTGLEATKANGSLTLDYAWQEFGAISAIPTSPTSHILTFDTATGTYVMVPSHLLGGGVSGIADAPINGQIYGRQSADWVILSPPASPTASIGLAAVNGSSSSAMRSDAAPALSQTIIPTWTGKHTFNGAAVINRPASSDGLTINNTVNGTHYYGFVETMTSTGFLSSSGGANYNIINVVSDDAQVGSNDFANALAIQYHFGGSSMIGGRQSLQCTASLTAPSSPSNSNRNYVAGLFYATAASHDNGTNTGAGAAGGVFALNPTATLSAGAINFLELSGGEVDFGMDSTASAQFMIGWSVVAGYNGGQNGLGSAALLSAGVSVSGIIPRTLDAGFVVGDVNSGWPIKSSGALFKAWVQHATPTVAFGIDLLDCNFSGAAFRSPNFIVTGQGSVTGTQFAFVVNTGATGSQVGSIRNTHNTPGDLGLIVGVGDAGATDTTSTFISFRDGTGSLGYGGISRNLGGVSYSSFSDRRLKENFRASSVGLEDLKRINVQDFNFIKAPDHDVNGFVAQDLYEAYPWAVTKDADAEKPWMIDYGRLTPLLVKAVQELSDKVDVLTRQIEAMSRAGTRSSA
jgi:hypothetical protein